MALGMLCESSGGLMRIKMFEMYCCLGRAVYFLFNSLGRVTHGITAGLVNHTSWGSDPDGVKLLT